MIFDCFEAQTLDEDGLDGPLVKTYVLSSCMVWVIYGRRDIRNHSNMFIILALSR